MLRTCLAAVALVLATTCAVHAESYQLSYVVNDDTGVSTIAVQLVGNGEVADDTIAECQRVTINPVAQNLLLTDLSCDGNEISASLSPTGIEIDYAGDVVAEIPLPAGEHWVNRLPILIETSAQ